MDPADKRQPNVKVAASIRAAILSGELEPGQRLPSGPELVEFFGVANMTVQKAIRTLADEGSSAPERQRLREDQASVPTPEEAEHPLVSAATFLFEMGISGTCPGPGQRLRIRLPETVAEHSFRVGIVGMTSP
jgi:DNA-binding GntR family transcriptional regulator